MLNINLASLSSCLHEIVENLDMAQITIERQISICAIFPGDLLQKSFLENIKGGASIETFCKVHLH